MCSLFLLLNLMFYNILHKYVPYQIIENSHLPVLDKGMAAVWINIKERRHCLPCLLPKVWTLPVSYSSIPLYKPRTESSSIMCGLSTARESSFKWCFRLLRNFHVFVTTEISLGISIKQLHYVTSLCQTTMNYSINSHILPTNNWRCWTQTWAWEYK